MIIPLSLFRHLYIKNGTLFKHLLLYVVDNQKNNVSTKKQYKTIFKKEQD